MKFLACPIVVYALRCGGSCTARWCNGSTRAFEAHSPGSSPGRATTGVDEAVLMASRVSITGDTMKVFSGNAHHALAVRISEYVGTPLGKIDIRRFPDGEIFVKIDDNIRGKDIYVVQSLCYPPNESLMELLIIIDAARRASAERITAVLPYFGYARQDRKDQPRVPITAKLVANLLVAAGVDRVLTLDLHAQQIQGFFDIPVDHLYAFPVIVQYLKSLKLVNPVVVAPDTGWGQGGVCLCAEPRLWIGCRGEAADRC
jgi:hypothetical protein